jgi:hypothetical protein
MTKIDIDIPKNIHLFSFKTNIMRSGFIYNSAILFNSLPQNIKDQQQLIEFKKFVKSYIIESKLKPTTHS